ncbi:MAG TPA: peptide deformylase [Opitutales bacterium]|nr:peptide deformylase [Opitutales bacterium]
MKYGDPVLRQRGADVTAFDKSLAAFASDMLETMMANEGIGLASQQVGQARRLFVADLLSRTPEAEKITLDGKTVPPALLMPFVAVNPEVEYLPGEKRTVEEGCLSFPEIRGNVNRPWAVRLRYQDLQGKPHVLETSGLFARVIQHEFDHVEGVLFIDRMDPKYVEELEPDLKKLKKLGRAEAKAGK